MCNWLPWSRVAAEIRDAPPDVRCRWKAKIHGDFGATKRCWRQALLKLVRKAAKPRQDKPFGGRVALTDVWKHGPGGQSQRDFDLDNGPGILRASCRKSSCIYTPRPRHRMGWRSCKISWCSMGLGGSAQTLRRRRGVYRLATGRQVVLTYRCFRRARASKL